MPTVKLIRAWALRILACWALFSALPAHAETPLVKGLCDEGWEQSGWLCYPKCKDNFHGRGPVCWQNCPSGFTDYGVGCSNLHVYAKHSYGRSAGSAMWCRPGTQQNGALCYPFCRSGYRGVGPVCWGSCPAGTDTDFGMTCTRWMRITGWHSWFIFRWPIIDWGWTKGKPSYGRGAGEPLSACPPGRQRSGALCYPFCNGGYTGAGPVCWQNCKGGYHDDGAFCRRDNGFTKASYGRGAGKPLSLCPNYARNTQYPIVLVHGWLGAPSYLDFGLKWFPGSTSYWGGIVNALRSGSRGNKNVFVARVSPTGTNTSRGEELRRFVEEVTRKTGHSRVHLIGHSQGGPTSRYVAAVAPEMVASVTTVAGVNHSPAFATTLTKWDEVLDGGNAAHGLVRMTFDAVALGINLAAYGAAPGEHWDNSKPLYAMTEDGMKLFNWMFPWGLTDIRKGKGQNWSNPLAFVSRPKSFDGKDAKEYLEIIGTGNLFKYKESLEQFQKSANEYKNNVTYHPEQYPVLYYSWAGKPPYTGSWGLNFHIFNPNFWTGNAGAPGFTIFNETTMLAAAVMAAANKITEDSLKAAPGDGMVDGHAARLGVQVGQYNHDHLMISNSFQSNLPLTHLWGKAHPITLFCEHANRLVLAERDILGLDDQGKAVTRFTGIEVNRYGQGKDNSGKPLVRVPDANTNSNVVQRSAPQVETMRDIQQTPSQIKGRYIYIRKHAGVDDHLSFAEVRVMSGGVNVALKKRVTSSGHWANRRDHAPENLVDGKTGGDWRQDGIFGSASRNQAWVQIDLGALREIDRMEYFAREHAPGQSRNFSTYVSDFDLSRASLAQLQQFERAGVVNVWHQQKDRNPEAHDFYRMSRR